MVDLREAYKAVTIHLLKIAEERGEESLSGIESNRLEELALDMINDTNYTDKLVESVENFIEDFGEDYDLW